MEGLESLALAYYPSVQTTSQARVEVALNVFRALVAIPVFPRFLTTHLYDQEAFQLLVRRS